MQVGQLAGVLGRQQMFAKMLGLPVAQSRASKRVISFGLSRSRCLCPSFATLALRSAVTQVGGSEGSRVLMLDAKTASVNREDRPAG